MRLKITQIIKVIDYLGKDKIIALCDDGTLWEYNELAWVSKTPWWIELPVIFKKDQSCEE